MFYIEVLNGLHIVAHSEEIDGGIEVDDDIDNFKLYYFNVAQNKIIKRSIVEYEVQADGKDVLISFKTDEELEVAVGYSNVINGEIISDGIRTTLFSEEGIATLRLSIGLKGQIYISSEDRWKYFEPIQIESDREVDNEYNPVFYETKNHITIDRSVDYKRFLSLQQEIESLKEILYSNGLVKK